MLDSTTTETDRNISHTLRLAFLYNQGVGRCDRIEVIDWTFSADTQSGEITRQFEFQYAVLAQRVDGTPVACTS